MEMVSIIVPCYNQDQYLNECLQSVIDQTYSNWECIIVNDGSNDGTRDVIDYLAFKYPGLRVINKENGGKRTAVAAGFYASKGKFLVLIDSDSLK